MNDLNTAANDNDNQAMTCLVNIANDINDIPNYLRREDPCFVQLIENLQKSNEHKITDDCIRNVLELSIISRKIILMELYQKLWKTCLESGTGRLNINVNENSVCSMNLSFWPKMLEKYVETKDLQSNPEQMHMKLIQTNLQLLADSLKQQIDHSKKVLTRLSDHGFFINSLMIEQHIESNIRPIRLRIQHEIDLISIDYHIHALKMQFNQKDPTSVQVGFFKFVRFRQNNNESRSIASHVKVLLIFIQKQFMKDLCSCTYHREILKHEHIFLRQLLNKDEHMQACVERMISTHSTDSLWFGESQTVGQQIRNRFRQIFVQSRKEMICLHLAAIEQQKKYHEQQFQLIESKMSNDSCFSTRSDARSTILFNIIHERCELIRDRVKCVHQYRIQLLDIAHI